MPNRRSQLLSATLEGRSGAQTQPTQPVYRVTGTNGSSDLRDQPVTQVLQRVSEESKSLINEELQLAKAEMSSKVKVAGKGAGMLGAAAVLGVYALGALTAAAVLALALVMKAWLAALVVALAYAVVAGILALAGRNKVQQATPLVPEQTVRTLGSLGQKLQAAWKRGQGA